MARRDPRPSPAAPPLAPHPGDPASTRRGQLDAAWMAYDRARAEWSTSDERLKQLRDQVETLAWRIWINDKAK